MASRSTSRRASTPRPSGPGAASSALVPGGGPELLDDGQEEVFAYSAVERGLVEDPKALGPADIAKAPTSPGRLDANGRHRGAESPTQRPRHDD